MVVWCESLDGMLLKSSRRASCEAAVMVFGELMVSIVVIESSKLDRSSGKR